MTVSETCRVRAVFGTHHLRSSIYRRGAFRRLHAPCMTSIGEGSPDPAVSPKAGVTC
jgi:hypothetical protein